MTPWSRRMLPRRADEAHRASTPLELLFDLTFVVAVAHAAARLAHELESNHAAEGLVAYLSVFFAIWWAWMNFTWFASAYDTDDAVYRLLTMVQMGGVLVLAAGVDGAFDGDYAGVTLGYAIMRVPLVLLWLRAGLGDPDGRKVAYRYAALISVAQVGWVLRLALPENLLFASFLVLIVAEVSVPLISERASEGRERTSWHPHHIAERYGLFTIIVLGESVLAVTNAVGEAGSGSVDRGLVVIGACGLVVLFGLWWLYFLHPTGEALAAQPELAFLWGYGHYGIFAGLAALGAGLEVVVAASTHEVEASPVLVAYAVAIPVAVVSMLLWALHARLPGAAVLPGRYAVPAAAILLVLPMAADSVGAWVAVAAPALVIAALVMLCSATVPNTAPVPHASVS